MGGRALVDSMAVFERNFQERNQTHVKNAQEQLKKATPDKDSDPVTYIGALMEVAFAVRTLNKASDADELFDIALETLRECSPKIPDVYGASQNCSYTPGH